MPSKRCAWSRETPQARALCWDSPCGHHTKTLGELPPRPLPDLVPFEVWNGSKSMVAGSQLAMESAVRNMATHYPATGSTSLMVREGCRPIWTHHHRQPGAIEREQFYCLLRRTCPNSSQTDRDGLLRGNVGGNNTRIFPVLMYGRARRDVVSRLKTPLSKVLGSESCCYTHGSASGGPMNGRRAELAEHPRSLWEMHAAEGRMPDHRGRE